MKWTFFVGALLLTTSAIAEPLLLRPAQVFDGITAEPHPGWEVLVDADRIAAVGPHLPVPGNTRTIELPGLTLMLTSDASVESETDGLAAGADDYILKPVEPRRLSARVKALLARARPVQAA